MSRMNAQAIIFALVVLGAVFVGRPESGDRRAATANEIIAQTSVGGAIDPAELTAAASVVVGRRSPLNAETRAALVTRIGERPPLVTINANRRWPIASLTKLMTAAIALEKFDPSQPITFNDRIIATEGFSGDFRAGETFSVGDLVKALMLVSSNDAAMALASAYGYPEFVDAMQEKAAELGMRQTSFFDPTGLSFLNQSTAADLERLVVYARRKHPDIFQWSRQRATTITGGNGSGRSVKRLVSINQFAGEPGFAGGKTGYTDDANGNLISLFQEQPNAPPLLIIVLGTNDRFGETKKLLAGIAEHYAPSGN